MEEKTQPKIETQPKRPQKEINMPEPLNLLVIGMAGSGKTTFMGKLNMHLLEATTEIPYTMNLDPAVQFTPYQPVNDIRKKVNYKEVMKNYGLGPNGAIMTSLNLYAAEFYQTLAEVEEQKKHHNLFLIDTPGQIEVFTWSASGQIISSTLSSATATAIVFVMDTVRCQNPNTFMSNMLFCCSILYKTKLPILVVFNKNDAADASIPINWMTDFESFMDEIREGGNYLSSLSRSLALALDEFYSQLSFVSVSSMTGDGFDKLVDLFPKLVEEYNTYYLPDLKKSQKAVEDLAQMKKVEKDLEKLEKDMQKEKAETKS